MHAHPQIKRPAAFGFEVMLAGVCKANSPLPPAPASPEQEQEHPWGVSKFGEGSAFPNKLQGLCADGKPRQLGRLAGASGNEHTSTNNMLMEIY